MINYFICRKYAGIKFSINSCLLDFSQNLKIIILLLSILVMLKSSFFLHPLQLRLNTARNMPAVGLIFRPLKVRTCTSASEDLQLDVDSSSYVKLFLWNVMQPQPFDLLQPIILTMQYCKRIKKHFNEQLLEWNRWNLKVKNNCVNFSLKNWMRAISLPANICC